MADARLSQLPVEVLVLSDTPIDLRLSQLPLEVLRSSTAETTAARLSQLPVEVLILETTGAADEARVTQAAAELLYRNDSDIRVTQALAEVLTQVTGEARVTQLLLEVIIRRTPALVRDSGIGPLVWVERPRLIVGPPPTREAFTPVPPEAVAPMVHAWLERRRVVLSVSEPSAVVPPPPEPVNAMTSAWLERPRVVL